MKLRSITLVFLFSVICLVPLFGQFSSGAQDETTRLMQEYMSRRTEWIELRQAALNRIKNVKDPAEKKQQLDKLAQDEKPALDRLSAAAQAYKAAQKAKRDQQSHPRG